MTVKIAINGYGRIGRGILRALYENHAGGDAKVVAVNATTDIDTALHLTRYDTTHGRFNADLRAEGDRFIVNGDSIRFFSERDPLKLPWGELGVDVVCECTGRFRDRAQAALHLQSGARKVLISAPGGDDVDATIVVGVNDKTLKPEHAVVSNASCTTNCLAPVAKVLHETVGIERGLITTIHAYTNDQVLIDSFHKDIRRARSATMSMVPTKTGAARAVGLVLPELAGKLHGYAVRVPTINVSVVDLTFSAARATGGDEINEAMRAAAGGAMQGLLEYCDVPLVSADFNHNPASAIYDATLTQVMEGRLVKVSAWYDNEWGYSNRMIDAAVALMRAG
ncbi:MAG: type I glyceraldehyde-3-phosphate dehydrogenase [Gammaproteobacteria bacterium]|nr:type I glyceraldehyde-3-phosphate dehydrogenase [Gammaproteobacteria bacterium]MDD9886160.1 type I glyceraldehyde-3-phosphate dehydrogenase [Gammaproteobacteria bacterium]